MLNQCQVFAKNDGGFRLELKAEHDNLPAKALYERLGFSKDETYVHCQVLI
jgi:ribosomal protein S18 acetylase RimI-like enzyme